MPERPNLSTGKPWSQLDLDDLKAGLERKDSIAAIAQFLCRTEAEVREKVRELGFVAD